jgi:DNA-nicking Smr family endonuclease
MTNDKARADRDQQEGEDARADSGAHQLPIEDALDLHTFHPRDIPSVVNEYITAAFEAGLHEVRLIHGRGRGVQRGIVQQVLDRHPRVQEFYDAPDAHLGATIAVLASSEAG